MITHETLATMARRYGMPLFPGVIREYFQHIFLAKFYSLPGAEQMLFKGGTALRIVYGSPRYSEDLDFTFAGNVRDIKKTVEDLFVKTLTEIERTGTAVEIGQKLGRTSGGYFGVATFHAFEYKSVSVEINVSARGAARVGREVETIVSDFVPPYTLVHMAQHDLVEEKIFGALCERKKLRDFYDFYFIMRKNMLTTEQKKRLVPLQKKITAWVQEMNFKQELVAFLPTDQRNIIRDFPKTLRAEMQRQLG